MSFSVEFRFGPLGRTSGRGFEASGRPKVLELGVDQKVLYMGRTQKYYI